MWITKTIGTTAQLCIIILAILMVYQFSSKQVYEGRVDSIERALNAKIDENKKYLNDKIIIQQDNVNRYIQLREDRAQLFASRIDTLYKLYEKDPNPIILANATPAQIVASVIPHKEESTIDRNLSYFENKVNSVSEKVDNLDNRLSTRVGILEQRFEVLHQDKKNNMRVIQTNINNNSVGAVAK